MLTNTKPLILAAGLLIALNATVAGIFAYPEWTLGREITACTSESDAATIDCWYRIIAQGLGRGGIAEAMEIFSNIYEREPLFANTGCHKHAHWVGDQVYYKLYLGINDLEAIEFPQSATACGYGLFHGFMEHLIQDHPDTDFITNACTYLKERYAEGMADISAICYHGSGHGLMLAQAEKMKRTSWGHVAAFTHVPLKGCEALPQANEREVEECREGVYNVLVDWMEQKQLGFSYDRAHPFRVCDREPAEWHQACYYEMAQKLDSITSFDPVRLEEFVASIKDVRLRMLAFDVGIAGMIQSHVSSPEEYLPILDRCGALREPFFLSCVVSILYGLMEHGSPQKEYERAAEVCRSSVVIARDAEEKCWKSFTERLSRFYSADRRREICADIPLAELRKDCTAG